MRNDKPTNYLIIDLGVNGIIVEETQTTDIVELQNKVEELKVNKYFILTIHYGEVTLKVVGKKQFTIYFKDQVQMFIFDRYPHIYDELEKLLLVEPKKEIQSYCKIIDRLKENNPKHIDIDYFKYYFPFHALKAITDLDPTPTKRYFKWLCNIWLNISLEFSDGIEKKITSKVVDAIYEDGPNQTELLIKFDKPKVKAIMKSQNKSINILDYKSDRDLFLSLTDIDEEETISKDELIKQQTIYEDSKWLVVKAENHHQSKEFGTGTYWCTASSNIDNNERNFETYTDFGRHPLYIFMEKDTTNKYQFAIYSGHFLDKTDEEFSYVHRFGDNIGLLKFIGSVIVNYYTDLKNLVIGKEIQYFIDFEIDYELLKLLIENHVGLDLFRYSKVFEVRRDVAQTGLFAKQFSKDPNNYVKVSSLYNCPDNDLHFFEPDLNIFKPENRNNYKIFEEERNLIDLIDRNYKLEYYATNDLTPIEVKRQIAKNGHHLDILVHEFDYRILQQVIEHGYGLDIIVDKICSFTDYPKNTSDKYTFRNVVEYLLDSGYINGLQQMLDHFIKYEVVSENKIKSIKVKFMEINRNIDKIFTNEYGFICFPYHY